MRIKAILFGATGMVGEGVLHEALKDSDLESILVVGRRTCGKIHPKLTELIHTDLFDLSSREGLLKDYHACFFCLGISSIGMTEKEYTRITYELTMHAARTLARLNPEMFFCYISGAGTGESSSMWARVKRRTENDLLALPFKASYMFRPGYIKPTPGLSNGLLASRIVAPAYPLMQILFSKYVCTLEEVGKAMTRVVKRGYPSPFLESRDIAKLGGTEDNP